MKAPLILILVVTTFGAAVMILNYRRSRAAGWLVVAGVFIGWAISAVMSAAPAFETMVEWFYRWWKSF
jgi:hypothetical protein